MDYSPPGSSIHGILQARIVEWVAIPSPGDLPDPGIKPWFPTLQADSLPLETPGKPQLFCKTGLCAQRQSRGKIIKMLIVSLAILIFLFSN